jgi:tetratricopeptide (TPR) repeat protein
MTRVVRRMASGSTLALAMVMLHLLQIDLDQRRSSTPSLQRFMYLPQGEYLKAAVLGYEHFVADVLWIQAIQAMGERMVSEEAGHWIARALDVITTLDPKFVRVYEAGGIALTTLVAMPEESNRLLQKGIRHNPDVWELPFLLGFNYYFELHDDLRAAEYIARASRLPQAPAYLAPFAARLYVSARNPEDAIVFLAQVYAQTTDGNLKQILERRLKEAMVERDLHLLEEAVSRYRVRNKRAPERLEDLIGSDFLRALPREPFGGRYLYNPLTGTVRSSEMQERWQLFGKRKPR